MKVKENIVVGRKMIKEIDGEKYYFDYAACLYPEGIIGGEHLFINDEDIQKICHKGYSDEDNNILVERIKEWEKENEIQKGYREVLFNKE